jgi:hypothetical protein
MPRRVIPTGRWRELPVEAGIGDQSDTVIYLTLAVALQYS